MPTLGSLRKIIDDLKGLPDDTKILTCDTVCQDDDKFVCEKWNETKYYITTESQQYMDS